MTRQQVRDLESAAYLMGVKNIAYVDRRGCPVRSVEASAARVMFDRSVYGLRQWKVPGWRMKPERERDGVRVIECWPETGEER